MRTVKRAALRAAMITVLPFAITWSVTARLLREVWSALRLAWKDACAEVTAFKQQWSDF